MNLSLSFIHKEYHYHIYSVFLMESDLDPWWYLRKTITDKVRYILLIQWFIKCYALISSTDLTLERRKNNQLNNNNSHFSFRIFGTKECTFFGASFRAIIFSLDRLCNERLFAPFVRLLSFNSVVKQKSAAAVEKKDRLRFQASTIMIIRISSHIIQILLLVNCK